MKEKLQNMSIREIVSLTFVSICFVVGIVMSVLQVLHSKQYETSYSSNNQMIESLTKELSMIKEIKETEELAITKLSSAASAGNKVAELQNKYKSLNAVTNEEAFVANVNEIGAYLSDNDKNKRVEWYSPMLYSVSYDWVFNTTYSFTETSIPVLWTCYDSDDRLLAYTTGVYNANTGLFSDVNYRMTTLGASYKNATDDTGDTSDASNMTNDSNDTTVEQSE